MHRILEKGGFDYLPNKSGGGGGGGGALHLVIGSIHINAGRQLHPELILNDKRIYMLTRQTNKRGGEEEIVDIKI